MVFSSSRSRLSTDVGFPRKLEKALRDLEPLVERGKITRFLNNVKDMETLTGLAEDIRDAMMDYQVRTRPMVV